MKEQSIAQRVMMEEARLGILGMRNNVGACQDQSGRLIRYGLMNESARQNKEIKSSDRILIVPTWCYRENIGWSWIGVFGAIETKHSDWIFHQSDERAIAQQAFHTIVRGYGGFAGFATKPEDVAKICGR